MIAILHVVINHAMAVGGIPLVSYLERRSLRTGDSAWDQLAFRILTVFFVITTTIGALTGVGIWFSASLVNPYAIGSLPACVLLDLVCGWAGVRYGGGPYPCLLLDVEDVDR